MKDMYCGQLGISEEVYNYGQLVLEGLKERFDKIDEVAEYNQLKVLSAMQKNKVAEMHLSGTSGYGYNDEGRDTLERIYADIFKTEDALVRPQIICGTHALNVAISSNLRPGDELLSPVGKPYDTMDEIIGIRPSKGSLAEYNISYRQVDLLADGSFDYDGIRKAINEKTKLVTIQRSKGYATRPTLSVERIGELIKFIKDIKPDVICMVDNCYGEFVETKEPTDVGADIICGSLIKNIGGGLCETGGYITGRKDLIELCAQILTCPGIGKECGATMGQNRNILQGIFMAPEVTKNALKAATFAAGLFKELGYDIFPDTWADRADIVQSIKFGDKDKLIKFIQGIQAASPVDSKAVPYPWDMPGYDSQVIMAAGTFIEGASIELSADSPIREPYVAYMQGGLTYESAKLAICSAVDNMLGDK